MAPVKLQNKKMPINLTVIFGAGASVDVIDSQSDQLNDRAFRPPITKDLFNTDLSWADEYTKFPAVLSVLEELRSKLYFNKDSTSVEKILRELKESPKLHRNKQFYELPMYLQHYFHHVSERYCKSPSNYLTLINKIFDFDFKKVLFLTTNYDLFFDKALAKNTATARDFPLNATDMNRYIKNENWAYIKLHGSVNWGRAFKENLVPNKGRSLRALLDNVSQLGGSLDESLEKEIVVDSTYKNESDRDRIYPAISVPIGEGYDKTNCPPKQIEVLSKHLDECEHFLVIGFSGYDEDVLELLNKKQGKFSKILFVSQNKASAENARSKFLSYKDLRTRLITQTFIYKGNGFNEFIKDRDGLERYLIELQMYRHS